MVPAPSHDRALAPNAKRPNGGVSLSVPPEFVEQVAQRVAAILVDHQPPAEDGWLRGAERIAAYIDCKPARVYALSSARRIPVEHDGSALIARRSELDAWLRNGGGRRP